MLGQLSWARTQDVFTLVYATSLPLSRIHAALALLSLALGCGDASSAADTALPDVGVDAPSDGGAPRVVRPPVPPAPPVFTPCPAGWLEVSRDGLTICEPWPAGVHSDECEAHEALFPSALECEAVGSACPAGSFSDDLPAADVLYVLAGASAPGDGSEASPFPTIGDAIRTAMPGTTIAIGAGRYTERTYVPTDVRIVGACARDTIISPPDDATASTLSISATATGVEIHDLTIEGGPWPGVFVSGQAHIEGVIVRDTLQFGIVVVEGSLTMRDVAIRDTHRSDTTAGVGLAVNNGAVADIERVAIERNHHYGVSVLREGSTLMARDLVIRDTRSHEVRGTDGRGLQIAAGVARVSASVFERNRLNGIVATHELGIVEVADSLIRDTLPQSIDGNGGVGIAIVDGAQGTIERTRMVNNQAVGLLIQRQGTLSYAEDLVVRDTQANELDGAHGMGIVVDEESRMTLARAVVRDNRHLGVAIQRAGTVADISDLVVTGTESALATDDYGIGLTTNVLAQSTIRRALIESNQMIGVQTTEGGAMVVEDLLVQGTRSETLSGGLPGHGGRGINVQAGSTFEGTRVSLLGNRELSLIVIGDGTSASFSDLRVADTLAQECAIDNCAEDPRGTAVGAYSGASLSIEGFIIADAPLCGIQIATEAEVDLSRGDVTGTAIGACLQVEGYDISRLTTDVDYHDNGTNLDSRSLPVPEASASGQF